MNIIDHMEKKNITKYRLSKISSIPYTTINDICNGKTDIKKCSAETVYKISKALGTTFEDLYLSETNSFSNFELFKSNACHRLKRLGDRRFLLNLLSSQEIRTLYKRKKYPESLYMLGMLDYLCRINKIPICKDYDDLRNYKLSKPIYPASVLAISSIEKNEKAINDAVKKAIPEFLRFNIIENEVRDVA